MKPAQIQALYTRCKPLAKEEKQPDWTLWQLKLEECVITAYKSGKVVFSGKDLSWLEEDQKEAPSKKSASEKSLAHTYPMAGSDEVGTGDFFGPVVVAACVVEDEQTASRLKAMGVTDSKALNDALIRKIGPEVEALCPHSVCVLKNPAYNQVHETINLNAMKAMLHNQVYLNLKHKGVALPSLCVVDQFCVPKSYFAYLKAQPKVQEIYQDLHFETKAESRYAAVAAASVLARYTFLKAWDSMEKTYDFKFEKGGGKMADVCGANFIEKAGLSALPQVAKVHFANTKKVVDLYNRRHPDAPLAPAEIRKLPGQKVV